MKRYFGLCLKLFASELLSSSCLLMHQRHYNYLMKRLHHIVDYDRLRIFAIWLFWDSPLQNKNRWTQLRTKDIWELTTINCDYFNLSNCSCLKRETKINNREVKHHVYEKTANGTRVHRVKHGHVVLSAVCRLPQTWCSTKVSEERCQNDAWTRAPN